MRDDVVRRIRKIITDLWPGAKLETFGSYNTGLYLPDGDIDMVVFGNWEKPPLWILRNKLIENRITREETISGKISHHRPRTDQVWSLLT